MNTSPAQPRAFSRTDQSFLGAWWWTVDKSILGGVLTLIVFGLALVASASPAVADRIGASSDYMFLKKHVIFLIPSIAILFGVSMLQPRTVWRCASIVFTITCILLLSVLIFGAEIKGARRWISIAGFSIQPSEFLKPAFAVVAAWLIALHKRSADKTKTTSLFHGYHIAISLYVVMMILLLMQPDLGMTIVLTLVFAVQIFIAGLRFRYLAILISVGAAGMTLAYATFHHVQSRIDRFFNPDTGDTFQVDKSLDAIRAGGFVGVGPGQGNEKIGLPDAHADFIFSVLAEEMGLIFSTALIGIFLFIILRGFKRLQGTQDLFSVLAAGGLLAMFGFQSLIHIGSAINILPAKGMTLPFVSYGGSSILSMALSFGIILALTRQRTRGSIARTSVTMRSPKERAYAE